MRLIGFNVPPIVDIIPGSNLVEEPVDVVVGEEAVNVLTTLDSDVNKLISAELARETNVRKAMKAIIVLIKVDLVINY